MTKAPKPPWEMALVQASIRGVPIWIESRDETGGHNLAQHEWVDADDVGTDNTGRRHTVWQVDAYLWGDNVLDQRRALRAALVQRAQAEYVDRWGERHQVYVQAWALRDQRRAGGWVDVRLDLVEAGISAATTSTINTTNRVENAADTAISAVADAFAAAWAIDGPSLLAEDAIALVTTLVAAVTGLSAGLSASGAALAALTRAGDAATGDVSSLVAAPSSLASRYQGLLGRLLALTGWDKGLADTSTTGTTSAAAAAIASSTSNTATDTADQAVRVYAIANSSALTDPAAEWNSVRATTPTRTTQIANRTALAALVRQSALVEAARASAYQDYDSYDQAVAIRAELTSALTIEIRGAGDDTLKAALRALSAAVVRDINTRAADLTTLSTISLTTSLPALVVAHQILGDATRADEILTRNPTQRDPLAVSGAIQVLAS